MLHLFALKIKCFFYVDFMQVHHQVQDLEKRLMAFNIVKPSRPPGYRSTTSPAQDRLILKVTYSFSGMKN